MALLLHPEAGAVLHRDGIGPAGRGQEHLGGLGFAAGNLGPGAPPRRCGRDRRCPRAWAVSAAPRQERPSPPRCQYRPARNCLLSMTCFPLSLARPVQAALFLLTQVCRCSIWQVNQAGELLLCSNRMRRERIFVGSSLAANLRDNWHMINRRNGPCRKIGKREFLAAGAVLGLGLTAAQIAPAFAQHDSPASSGGGGKGPKRGRTARTTRLFKAPGNLSQRARRQRGRPVGRPAEDVRRRGGACQSPRAGRAGAYLADGLERQAAAHRGSYPVQHFGPGLWRRHSLSAGQ